ncbi:tetratricopeptide repeat protein [Catenuloplanes atrovinosus]|uniref:Tetratricopeptide (TPR) repeat protein n=1 Tax=Catenuloplanes atrovinosus TaxID=137266 RepID=A0AAE3YQI6_9ACTN|nr:tetratricopeptide repeat protein [Catenuloplanes atrovinosus]MDR7277820.1 tetratricopeptide (TPR) repeat protein [Catenuloplanes atrovinosus]
MTTSAQELWGLLAQAGDMPYGAARIALTEQVIRHADAAGDPELRFVSRIHGTQAYVYGGEPAKAFVTFSWCLAEFDSQPAPYHANWTHTLLWYFKTMISQMTGFPEVPLDRAQAVLDDMERRYREGGHSLQAVYKYRYVLARHVGDTEATARWYERWQAAPRDELSDCEGCDPTGKARYLADQKRDEEVVALAEPVLAGRLTCTEQPQNMLATLMVPYVRTGRLDAAVDAHRRAYGLIRSSLADLGDIGDHIEFCARTGNEHRGLEIVQRHIDWLDRAPSPAAAMTFASASALLLGRAAALGHGDTVVHRAERGDTTVAALADELAAEARAIAARFDARNGTTRQSRRVEDMLAAEPFGVELPLSPTARAAAPVPPVPQRPAPPAPEVPAEATAEQLLTLAEDEEDADRDGGPILNAFDARFPDPAALGPALAAKREALRGGQHWDRRDGEAAAAAWDRAAELYAEAGDHGEAVAVSGRAGIARLLLGDESGAEAVEREIAYREEHGGTPKDVAAAWSRLALRHMITGDADASMAAQERADAALADVDEPRMHARYAVRRAQIAANGHRHEEATEAIGRALIFFREHGPDDQLAGALLLAGQLSTEPEAALALFDEVLSLGDPETVVNGRLGRANALMRLERPAEAVPELIEVVALLTEQDLLPAAAAVRRDLAEAYQAAGRLTESAEVAEEALSELRRLGDDDRADDAQLLLANTYRQLGEDKIALIHYEALITRMTEIENYAGRGQIREYAAETLYRADRDEEAAERFGEAADDFHQAGNLLAELRVLRRRVASLHFADEPEEAVETVALARTRDAELPAEATGHPQVIWERHMLGWEAGRVLMSRGRYADAIPYLAGAAAALREIGATGEADNLAGMYAEALFRSGDPAAAEPVLREVLAGASPDAANVPAALLAEVLDALDRKDEATALRSEYGITARE